MNKYIAYFNDSSCQSLRLYSSIDSLESYQNFSNIQQLNFLEENDRLYGITNEDIIGTYKFDEIKTLSNNYLEDLRVQDNFLRPQNSNISSKDNKYLKTD